jgi:hypothetical protein
MNHRTFSPACQIADRAIVWALFRNGVPVLQDGAPSTLSAVEIAETASGMIPMGGDSHSPPHPC